VQEENDIAGKIDLLEWPNPK